MPVSSLPRTAQSNRGSPMPGTELLRILIVDDNHINLAVLSTLLKRRFSHLLACPPVALDSGLKAVQALRTEVFDLIFMDIEMPYLDGVECTRRIRAGEDGILQPNSSAHIVAVTTKVGDGPGELYRQVGMNGMISKPVRFEHFRQYLCPLALEARRSHASVSPVMIDGSKVMPPLPALFLEDREFFTPLENDTSMTMPSSHSSDGSGEFAAILKAQTIKSFSDRKTISMARAGTLSLPRRSSFNSPQFEHVSTTRSTSLQQSVPAKPDSFESLVDQEADSQERINQAQHSQPSHRPSPMHRLSSPAYMLDFSPSESLRRESDGYGRSGTSSHCGKFKRPSMRPLKVSRAHLDHLEETEILDSTASPSSAWSNAQVSAFRTDSGTCNTSSSSAATTPLSSPFECGLDWQDMFEKVVFSTCADDMALPQTKTAWEGSPPSADRHFQAPTRPLTAPLT